MSLDTHPAPAAAPKRRSGGNPDSGTTKASAEDLTLAGRLLSGDEDAFTALVTRYHGALLRLALTFTSNRAVAEEVVQETWLAVLTGLPGFEGRSALKSWIFAILANRAKTRAVREKRSIPFSDLAAPPGDDEPAVDPDRFTPRGAWLAPPAGWHDLTPEHSLLQRETIDLIQRTVEALPPNQRAVITLRDFEGLDAADACNILGLSETNQRVLLHRARSRVRSALERHLSRT
jgi:RNA polymerase sigma-70 factor (ECF subfamily)